MISQKVVFKFCTFLCIKIEYIMVHLHTKNHFGDYTLCVELHAI